MLEKTQYKATLIFVLSLVTLCYSDWDSNCQSCECKWSSGKKVANCTNAKLNSIPQNLHAEVQVLILDHNFISSLGENIFIRNLPNLQKISLRHCGIKTINEKAFNGLKILVEVDLSHNNISKFGSRTFMGNNRLKTINLSHNPIRNLVELQFPVLPYLKTLDFSECVIEHIDRKAFGNLGNSIETISLKGNKLRSLQEDIFLSTTNIKSLELHQNPWRCDCHLKQFRDWVVDKGLYNYPTTCKDPERLSDKMWDVVQSSEFACKPQIEVSQRRVYSQPGANITLSCFITGNPVPEAKWVLRGRIVTNNTSPLYGNNENIQYVIHEKGGFERWFNLTVVNISEEDADDYTCVGVNAGGVSEQNVSLTFDQPKISPDTHEPVENSDNIVAIIGAVALATSLSLISCALYCCLRHKCIKRTGEQDSYSGSIVGISSNDQQSLIQQPKGILKTSHDHSRYTESSMDVFTGQQRPRVAGGMVGANTQRSLAESSGSGVSQATLHSYDASGHYPDLLNIPNRDLQTSPTTTTTASTTFSHQIMDGVSTIRLASSQPPPAQASTKPRVDQSDLICTCPHPPGAPVGAAAVSPESYSVIATAAILPPPPNFLCSEAVTPGVKTVPIPKYQQNSAPCFVTLPRNPRRQQTPISVAGLGVAEVRLAPYFDGTGPRTSANGSMETQNQVGPEMIEALPPPPMFCSVCENDTTNCCTEEEPNNLFKDGKPKKQIMKKAVIGNEHGFSTLPNPRSHSFGSKKPGKEDCKAGIQV